MLKINRSTDSQFYVTIHASNGKVLCTSETYKRKRSCETYIAAMIKVFKNKPLKVVDKAVKK
jgi:uncharacterized protein YegP (UPF0339 family)